LRAPPRIEKRTQGGCERSPWRETLGFAPFFFAMAEPVPEQAAPGVATPRFSSGPAAE
jgi:hypothetical protein